MTLRQQKVRNILFLLDLKKKRSLFQSHQKSQLTLRFPQLEMSVFSFRRSPCKKKRTPGLVAANMAGDVPTFCQKYLALVSTYRLKRFQLTIKNILMPNTRLAMLGGLVKINRKYLLVSKMLAGAVITAFSPVTPPSSPPTSWWSRAWITRQSIEDHVTFMRIHLFPRMLWTPAAPLTWPRYLIWCQRQGHDIKMGWNHREIKIESLTFSTKWVNYFPSYIFHDKPEWLLRGAPAQSGD